MMPQELRKIGDRAPVAFDPGAKPADPLAIAIAPKRRPGRNIKIGLALTALGIAAVAGGFYWWQHRAPEIPAGIAWSNGRIEADEIDIETKFAGRVAAVFADEGDTVSRGQAVAKMDTRDLEDALHRDESIALQAAKAVDEAQANIVQQQTTVDLAGKQVARTQALLKSEYAPRELYDQRKQQLEGARAGAMAAVAKLGAAEQALAAARHQVELDRTNIADNMLLAPKDGRIEYRISNIGEVLGAGGKIFTMLDFSYVYMDVYLPMAEAGKVRIGDEARILLDARSDRPLPARVSFLASQAQFTPKSVETKSERDKLMFRVRIRLDDQHAREFLNTAGTGLPGLAYIRMDPKVAWPAKLQPKS
jgi:HlyD family secretion protein